MDRTIVAAGTDHEAIASCLDLALALARPFGAQVVLAGSSSAKARLRPPADTAAV